MTNAEARFNNSLRPRKPEGSLGRTAQDGHLVSHTAPELCKPVFTASGFIPGVSPHVMHALNVINTALGVLLLELRCPALKYTCSIRIYALYGAFCYQSCMLALTQSSHDFMFCARPFAANAAHLTETRPRAHNDFKHRMLWRRRKKRTVWF